MSDGGSPPELAVLLDRCPGVQANRFSHRRIREARVFDTELFGWDGRRPRQVARRT